MWGCINHTHNTRDISYLIYPLKHELLENTHISPPHTQPFLFYYCIYVFHHTHTHHNLFYFIIVFMYYTHRHTHTHHNLFFKLLLFHTDFFILLYINIYIICVCSFLGGFLTHTFGLSWYILCIIFLVYYFPMDFTLTK